ncbi:ATP phosphoribosyltransferase regulatory subunit [Cardiobacteriaceae bacterium TAE3-ERU3]|nr:ATP phosphoribosyltransferase regulatory subunit [Cardiobacteriaceae bacterium TAE3-ERU3]
MNTRHIIASLFCLGLTLSAHADMHPAPLPEEATRIENISEADLIGTWSFEEDIPYAKVINYSEIRADHTSTDDTLVTAQTGETVKSPANIYLGVRS